MPHSEIVGSRLGSSSPTLIAAAHVLLRHSTPRHPPHACSSFFLCPPSSACTGCDPSTIRLLPLLPESEPPRLGTTPHAGGADPAPSSCPWSNSVKYQTHSDARCHFISISAFHPGTSRPPACSPCSRTRRDVSSAVKVRPTPPLPPIRGDGVGRMRPTGTGQASETPTAPPSGRL